MKDVEELRRAVNEYFGKVTDEQLDEDFQKAEWEVYSRIDVNLFGEKGRESSEAPCFSVDDEAGSTHLKGIVTNLRCVFGTENRPRYYGALTIVSSSNREWDIPESKFSGGRSKPLSSADDIFVGGRYENQPGI